MTRTLSASLISPRIDAPSLGPLVVDWMEAHLVYGPGDLQGQPFRVAPFLREFLEDFYRVDSRGRRIVRRALLGVPKGNAKTEIAAAVALNELAGLSVVDSQGRASRRHDPDIPVAAASFDQADLVFSACRAMCEPIADLLDVYDTEILPKGEPGRLYRVAAVAGTNDGRRPTCFIADELHEWLDRKARVHLVLGNGLAKRTDSAELNITTAGADPDTVAGRLYEYGKKVASGEVEDPSFLIHWYEAPEVDLDDPEALREAIRVANPADWIDPERVAQRYELDRIPAYEFRRYHLNQWVAAGEEWLPYGAWDELAVSRDPPEAGARVVLGFDGSYNRDATAVYGWTVEDEPYGWLLGVWERPEDQPDWVVPRHEIHKVVDDAMRTWQVLELVCDRAYWYDEYDLWAELYGEPPVIEFSSPDGKSRRQAFAQACALFYAAVVQGDLTHDGHPAVARHLRNARVKETPEGAYIVKDGRNSPRKIDAAVAAIQSFARAKWYLEQPEIDPVTQIW